MVPSTVQPLSMAASRASSNDIPLIVAMVVRFREEYAFDISLITRSRTLSAKIRGSKSGNSVSAEELLSLNKEIRLECDFNVLCRFRLNNRLSAGVVSDNYIDGGFNNN